MPSSTSCGSLPPPAGPVWPVPADAGTDIVDPVAAVLTDLAEVVGSRAVDAGDDVTQAILDRAFDALIDRLHQAVVTDP